MSSAYTTVFEYDYLCFNKSVADNRGYVFIPKSDFDYLSDKVSQDEQSNLNSALKWQRKKGVEVIQVQNYAGVIFLPSGQHIEVLPKTGKASSTADDARQVFLTMLRALGEFKHIHWENVGLDTQKMPLFEVFIRQFLESVNHIIKRGLRSDYIKQEDNLLFKKGKLNVSRQLRHNLVQQHRFYCEFDEFLQDRPENRLIKSALSKVGSYCKSHRNQKLTNEFLFSFDAVPESKNISQDFERVRLTRGMEYYSNSLTWAKLILSGLSPTSVKGDYHAPSLLFPMEQLFEAYVARVLAGQLGQGYELVTQAQSKSLVRHVVGDNAKEMFALRPDLVIKQSNETKAVLDTKWKLLNPEAPDKKFGMSQADFYQMYAYGQKYLAGNGDLILIYPATSKFSVPISGYFALSETLRLWVVPFDIKANGQSELAVPAHEKFPRLLA
ncbi:McrC family protein [Enterovibrio sp. ZSDZ42]|uniref:McrC family protein n=1 Tax=Enterovibrio gelatinilyticus TaxID=2899819 RepID=A0ABT5R6S9_9GAMM|nr:McrC family protein [Enterovibrio sp. ZSDZ42]MDD1795535.1 McrC family protein [Enterovibrio sp. ZSDZ42]